MRMSLPGGSRGAGAGQRGSHSRAGGRTEIRGDGAVTPGRTLSACMKSSGRSFRCCSCGARAQGGVTLPAPKAAPHARPESGTADGTQPHQRERPENVDARHRCSDPGAGRGAHGHRRAGDRQRKGRHLEVRKHLAHGNRRTRRAHGHGHVDLLLVPKQHLQAAPAPAARTHAHGGHTLEGGSDSREQRATRTRTRPSAAVVLPWGSTPRSDAPPHRATRVTGKQSRIVHELTITQSQKDAVRK